jgi:hypothetical protein
VDAKRESESLSRAIANREREHGKLSNALGKSSPPVVVVDGILVFVFRFSFFTLFVVFHHPLLVDVEEFQLSFC